MNTTGWAMLILTWGLILGLCGFCFWKVLSKKEDRHSG
jgi:hypothetical protein